MGFRSLWKCTNIRGAHIAMHISNPQCTCRSGTLHKPMRRIHPVASEHQFDTHAPIAECMHTETSAHQIIGTSDAQALLPMRYTDQRFCDALPLKAPTKRIATPSSSTPNRGYNSVMIGGSPSGRPNATNACKSHHPHDNHIYATALLQW